MSRTFLEHMWTGAATLHPPVARKHHRLVTAPSTFSIALRFLRGPGKPLLIQLCRCAAAESTMPDDCRARLSGAAGALRESVAVSGTTITTCADC